MDIRFVEIPDVIEVGTTLRTTTGLVFLVGDASTATALTHKCLVCEQPARLSFTLDAYVCEGTCALILKSAIDLTKKRTAFWGARMLAAHDKEHG